MTDDVLHWRECESCFRRAPQDAMTRCPRSGAWRHEDCRCECEDCLSAEYDARADRQIAKAER